MSLTEAEFKKKIVDFIASPSPYHEWHWKEEVSSWNSQSVRFDLAFCQTNKENGALKLIGVEIKTDKDSFKRLNRQLPNYLLVFDEVYIATESKTIPKQVPALIGHIKALKSGEEYRLVYAKHSFAPEQTFADYMNEFVFKRALASLNFSMNEKNKELLKEMLSTILQIRKKFIANTIFGSRVSTDDYSNKDKMAFTIPFTKKEQSILESCFNSRVTHKTDFLKQKNL